MANDIGKSLVGSMLAPTPADAVSKTRATAATRLESVAKEAKAVEEAAAKPESGEAIEEVVSGLNEMVQNLHRNLQFSVDDGSGDTVIKVVDSETREVVRQIPSEEIVRLRERMKDAAGMLFQGAV